MDPTQFKAGMESFTRLVQQPSSPGSMGPGSMNMPTDVEIKQVNGFLLGLGPEDIGNTLSLYSSTSIWADTIKVLLRSIFGISGNTSLPVLHLNSPSSSIIPQGWLQATCYRGKSVERDALLRLLLPEGGLHHTVRLLANDVFVELDIRELPAVTRKSMLLRTNRAAFGPSNDNTTAASSSLVLTLSKLGMTSLPLSEFFMSRLREGSSTTVVVSIYEYWILFLLSTPLNEAYFSERWAMSSGSVLSEELSTTLPSPRALICYILSKYLIYFFPVPPLASLYATGSQIGDPGIAPADDAGGEGTLGRSASQPTKQSSAHALESEHGLTVIFLHAIAEIWLLSSFDETDTFRAPHWLLMDAIVTLQLHIRPRLISEAIIFDTGSLGLINHVRTLYSHVEPIIIGFTIQCLENWRETEGIGAFSSLLNLLALVAAPWKATNMIEISERALPKRKSWAQAQLQMEAQAATYQNSNNGGGRKYMFGLWQPPFDDFRGWSEYVWTHSVLYLVGIPTATRKVLNLQFSSFFDDDLAADTPALEQHVKFVRSSLYAFCRGCKSDALAETIQDLKSRSAGSNTNLGVAPSVAVHGTITGDDLELVVRDLAQQIQEAQLKSWYRRFWLIFNGQGCDTATPDLRALAKCLGIKKPIVVEKAFQQTIKGALNGPRVHRTTPSLRARTSTKARKSQMQYEALFHRIEAQGDPHERQLQLRQGRRICSNIDMVFEGDVWDAPVFSYESELALKLMYRLSMVIQDRTGMSINLRIFASYFGMLCVLLVCLMFFIFL